MQQGKAKSGTEPVPAGRRTLGSMPSVRVVPLQPIMPLATASELTGLSTDHLRKMIRQGRLKGSRTTPAGSGRWLIETRSLLAAVGMEA